MQYVAEEENVNTYMIDALEVRSFRCKYTWEK